MLKRTANFFVREARSVTDEVADAAVQRNLKLIQAGVTADPQLDRFKEIVAGIKKVAPRSDDFIYFVCRAIHSMEAANLDPVTGELVGDGRVDEKGRWVSASGRTPFPYVNQNGDAFPEAELLKVVEAGENGEPDKQAYHSFIGRGLFVNHASDDAEKIRGIILDATWDEKTKGVDLLVACDKIAYPELARQIQAGYSNDVSMGTQVAYSVCSECGNSAKTEDDYCDHILTAKGSFFNGRPVYEANFGLNFIEISVVATGADPKAKIRQVLAHLNKAVQARRENLAKLDEKQSDSRKVAEAQREVDKIRQALHIIASTENLDEINLSSLGIDQTENTQMATNSDETESFKSELATLRTQLSELQQQIKNIKGAEMATSDRKAYFNNEGEPDSGLNTTEQNEAEFKQDYKTVRDTQDKQMVGQGMESGSTGMHPGYGESDQAVKERLMRAEDLKARKQKREALMKTLAYFNSDGEPDTGLNTTEQNEAEFKQDYKTVRDTQDKQMVGQGMESGSTGMHPGYGESDQALKQRLQRANKLRAKLRTAQNKSDSRWIVFAGEQPILEATAGELYGDDLDAPNPDNQKLTNYQWVISKDYGRNLIAAIRELGLDEVKRQIQAASSCSTKEMNMEHMDDQTEDEKEDEKDDKKSEASSKSKKAKAQLDEQPLQPAEAGGEPELEPEAGIEEEAAAATEDTDLELEEEGGLEEEAASKDIPADTAAALQEVADMIADAGEQLAALLGAEGALADEAMAEGEEIGEEVIEAGGELEELDKAMSDAEAGAPEDLDEEQLAIAKSKLQKLIAAAAKDAKVVVKKAQTFIKAHSKPKGIQERRAARRAMAQKLYDLTDEDMTAEAHPKGNTTAVPGYEVKTGHGIQDASVNVATKNPTGNLTASQKARRVKVAKFIKAMDYETEKGRQPQEEGDTEEGHGIDELPNEKMKQNAKDMSDDGKLNDSVEKEASSNGRKSEAAADADASKYYSELYNSDSDAKSFASDLTKDYHGKQSTADLDKTKGKMHRAYKVALRQAQLGQINNTSEAVENQVETLMSMDDTGFDSFSKAVENTAKAAPQATASSNGSVLRTASANVPDQGTKVETPVGTRSAAINDLADRLGKLGWSVAGRR